MDALVPRPDEWPDADADEDGSPGRILPVEQPRSSVEVSWLAEIVEQLERDPEECWPALEALTAIEPPARQVIIEELSGHGTSVGVRTLLRLLSGAPDALTRGAARDALKATGVGWEAPDEQSVVLQARSCDDPGSKRDWCASLADREWAGRGLMVPDRWNDRLARCLVTPVDAQGRGIIVISTSRNGQRRTAAFWCDVRRGILDVIGEAEPESTEAGRLVAEIAQQAAGDCAHDTPLLALGLLGGSLLLAGPRVSSRAREWLDGTLGPEFHSGEFPAMIPGLERWSIPEEAMPAQARAILEACPSWRDSSPLTYDLAEEIWVREGRVAADPERDAGAYRFLFEHRLIHRLELYGRMLIWMAWLWHYSLKTELARSAMALAAQLADQQYSVPSHPFVVTLTTRSLEAAQIRLGGPEDPRRR
jgi:hypothetical protein